MKKFHIDTNIIIRLLIKDVTTQFEEAKSFFEKIEKGKIKGVISVLVINETIWVLENYYELKRLIYIPQLLQLLALKNIVIKEIKKKVAVELLEEMMKTNIDFTDLYLVKTKEEGEIMSFDKDLKKLKID
ncbi:PIN domain-containing protein [Candidatus Gottesmanbacteria bacterium]|nr:PIN domain-containing protein [Candidatus Gottesmanbacteria bacterium]